MFQSSELQTHPPRRSVGSLARLLRRLSGRCCRLLRLPPELRIRHGTQRARPVVLAGLRPHAGPYAAVLGAAETAADSQLLSGTAMLKLSPGMNVRPLAQACTASNLVVSTCKPRPGTCLPNYPPRYITVQRHMHMGCERGTATSKQACSCIMTCGSESRAAHRAPGLQRSQAHAARVRKARRRRGAPGRGRRHRRLALPGGQHAPRRWPCSAADARVCQLKTVCLCTARARQAGADAGGGRQPAHPRRRRCTPSRAAWARPRAAG